MTSFHADLRSLTNFKAWNSLPVTVEGKEGAIRNEVIQQILFSDNDSNFLPTFQALADKAVVWINDHKDELTKEDADSLKKLRGIFLSQLPPEDSRVVNLANISRSLESVTDHSSKISHDFDSVTRYLSNRNELLLLIFFAQTNCTSIAILID